MFHRHLRTTLLRRATELPVVTVTGPRQSGKTTLVRHAFPHHTYTTLERPDVRARALDDPLGWLAQQLAGGAGGGVILDEIQRAPALLSYIQSLVDDDPTPGRFILTGSQNLLLKQGVAQSLAGRTAILHLLPLSMAEIRGHTPVVPEQLDTSTSAGQAPVRSLWEHVYTGGYPRLHTAPADPARDDPARGDSTAGVRPALNPTEWLADYRRRYVERDVRDVLRVTDLDGFDRFLGLCAARTGCELNLSELASDAGIAQPTARAWLTALRTGFIVALLQPHHRNFRKRLRKRPKLHFVDTGLACQLLGIYSATVLANHPLRAALFESFVVGELDKAFANLGRTAPLFHWRDARGREIDVVMDLGDRLVPIEVKSGRTVAPDAAAGLRWWLGQAGNENTTGVLVHGGDAAFGMREVAVRPWWVGG